MSALVSMRNNTAGHFSPSMAERAEVGAKLAQTADARLGNVARQNGPEATSFVPGATEAEAPRGLGDDLDKDAFLQLLVLQMQNQDPLEPVDNADMLAQLAQFSALEGQNNLNSNFERLSSNVDQLNFISASQMLGKSVEGVNLNGEMIEGVVEGVHLDGSVVVLTVNGEYMSMAGIVKIGDQVVEEGPGDGAGE